MTMDCGTIRSRKEQQGAAYIQTYTHLTLAVYVIIVSLWMWMWMRWASAKRAPSWSECWTIASTSFFRQLRTCYVSSYLYFGVVCVPTRTKELKTKRKRGKKPQKAMKRQTAFKGGKKGVCRFVINELWSD